MNVAEPEIDGIPLEREIRDRGTLPPDENNVLHGRLAAADVR